jgi:hypothetical protein
MWKAGAFRYDCFVFKLILDKHYNCHSELVSESKS